MRYCATPAGRVAYATTGSGPPLLIDTGWVTHLAGQLELFSFGAFTERLAVRFTVIRYDKPGWGLSDTAGTDPSFDGQVAAARAVADAARADRFSLFGASQAARSPRRSRRGTRSGWRRLRCTARAPAAPTRHPPRSGTPSWRWCGRTGPRLEDAGRHLHARATPEEVAALTRLQRAAASAEIASRLLAAYYGTDIRSLLPAIRARAVVLHRERGLFRWIRHPLMAGFLVVFWAAPVLTLGHVLLAALATGYILAGIRFEERDLRRDLGESYRGYAARVPALIPRQLFRDPRQD